MIVLPLDEADHEAVLNFLLPELVRNGPLIADCTVLRDEARVFVAEKAGTILGAMAHVGNFVGMRCTSENVFRKLLGEHAGALSGGLVWSTVAAEELAHIDSQTAVERTEPLHQMLYDPILGPVQPSLPETLARRLTVADLGLMRRFYDEIATEHWTPDALKRGPFHGIVEDVSPAGDKALVAAAGSYYMTDWLGEVGMVGVLPRYRRRGYGTLVSHLVTQEILTRSKKVCLHVVKKDRGPHELYLRMGYRDVGEAFLVIWRV